MASHPIYQFYAELDDFTPKIWRRFRIGNHVTIARLAYTVMIMYEMMASHLFAVHANSGKHLLKAQLKSENGCTKSNHERNLHKMSTVNVVYELPNLIAEDYSHGDPLIHTENAHTAKLHQAVDDEGQTMRLNYDFGDNWWITLTLERIIIDKETPGSHYPVLFEGAGFGIVEDCGGTRGLQKLVEAFTKKRGEEYTRFKEWLGVDVFDIHAFGLDDLNFRMKKLPIIYKYLYEDQKPLTKRALDLLERNY